MKAIFAWLSANLATILICAVLIAVVALLIYSLIRDKKKGKSCCSGCSGCVHGSSCPTASHNQPPKRET